MTNAQPAFWHIEGSWNPWLEDAHSYAFVHAELSLTFCSEGCKQASPADLHHEVAHGAAYLGPCCLKPTSRVPCSEVVRCTQLEYLSKCIKTPYQNTVSKRILLFAFREKECIKNAYQNGSLIGIMDGRPYQKSVSKRFSIQPGTRLRGTVYGLPGPLRRAEVGEVGGCEKIRNAGRARWSARGAIVGTSPRRRRGDEPAALRGGIKRRFVRCAHPHEPSNASRGVECGPGLRGAVSRTLGQGCARGAASSATRW